MLLYILFSMLLSMLLSGLISGILSRLLSMLLSRLLFRLLSMLFSILLSRPPSRPLSRVNQLYLILQSPFYIGPLASSTHTILFGSFTSKIEHQLSNYHRISGYMARHFVVLYPSMKLPVRRNL